MDTTPLVRSAKRLRIVIERTQEKLDQAKAERDELIVEMLDAKLTHREIADLLGISREWVPGARLRYFYAERGNSEQPATEASA